jgi:hypothetical protein
LLSSCQARTSRCLQKRCQWILLILQQHQMLPHSSKSLQQKCQVVQHSRGQTVQHSRRQIR